MLQLLLVPTVDPIVQPVCFDCCLTCHVNVNVVGIRIVVTPLHTNRTGEQWTKRSQETLLSKLEQHHLDQAAQKAERDKAFDLLDALSRSGSLPVACAELHVLVAATHCFDKSLMNTIIQDNVRQQGKLSNSLMYSVDSKVCI